ncbi:MAG TPA: UDP-glucose 4-epimerase GalE [Elusimicrobiales bacterium]|nr:UDP-glucose 4-epimerase GalE [Elusimicrobiales bacterium]HPO94838.1 UDP-glucose 4-epimerase GalE [Elusimicrobiales bacterium]
MILIAGGAGYIGSHVNKMISRKGYDTVVLDNLVYGHKEFVKWGKFYKCDLCDVKEMEKIFKSNKIDAVMHFSAYTYVGESVADPSKYYKNNVSNTLNLLDVMVKYGVKKFIFSSTCATYGFPIEIPITESHPQNPINPYGKTKLMIEKILEDYDKAYGLKYINLRYFNASGADPDLEIGEWHNPETHLIPLALYNALGLTPKITVFGTDYDTEDGTCVRDYIHVNDLAKAHILALEYLNQKNKSDSFNLGNGRGFSVKKIIDTVEKVSGLKLNVEYGKRREGDPAILVGSSKKAIKVLGWKPEFYKIEDIVETAYLWHKKNKDKISEDLWKRKI